MKMINLASVSNKKSNEKSNYKINPVNSENTLHKIDNFNSIVMSGTAKRKTVEQKESRSAVKYIQKNNFNESLMKLRAPFCKPHQKQVQEEKLITKSCEILFECIKPYKNIRVTKKTKMKESIRNGGHLLKATNIIYQWKATRKELITFPHEKSIPTFFLNKHKILPGSDSMDFCNQNLNEPKYEDFVETEENTNQASRTASSEDFLTGVLSEFEVLI